MCEEDKPADTAADKPDVNTLVRLEDEGIKKKTEFLSTYFRDNYVATVVNMTPDSSKRRRLLEKIIKLHDEVLEAVK